MTTRLITRKKKGLRRRHLGGQMPSEPMVSTLAGNGNRGFADGLGAAASFNMPQGAAVDASGNVYVVDTLNHRIRKVTPGGVVTTFAGTGGEGAVDGPALNASFRYPSGVAVDSSGNVYVADAGTNLIRKVTPGGMVSTLAGSGTAMFADGTGAAASFNYPTGIAVDLGGNLYVADARNNLIRKVTRDGVVTTLAGIVAGSIIKGKAPNPYQDGTGTTATFNFPVGIAVGAGGDIYVADFNNHRIRKVTPGGIVSTLAGNGTATFADGPGTAAAFNYPYSLAVDAGENVYVADNGNQRIRKVRPDGLVTTLAGSGAAGYSNMTQPALTAPFAGPRGVAVDTAGNLFVVEYNNNCVKKITNAFLTTTTRQIAAPPNSTLPPPNNMLAPPNNMLPPGTCTCPCPTTSNPMTTGPATGPPITTARSNTTAVPTAAATAVPTAVPTGFPTTTGRSNITAPATAVPTGFPTTTGRSNVTAAATGVPTAVPTGVPTAVPTGFPTTTGRSNITAAATAVPTGFPTTTGRSNITAPATAVPTGFPTTTGRSNVTAAATAVPTGFPTTTGRSTTTALATTTIPMIRANITTIAGGSRGFLNAIGTAAKFNGPWGIAKDSLGNIYIADCDAHIIRKMDPSGNVSTFAGSSGMLGRMDGAGSTARFNQPHGLVIDTNNNLYVADSNNHAIRKIEPSGNVTTFAGGSDAGAYADGKGSAAKFFSPYGIFIDKANTIYVADTSNHRIRKIDPYANVTTFAGSSSRGYVDGPGASATFNSPYAVTIDTTNNIMYVADWDNARIRKITMLPTPIVTTLAGNGKKTYKDGIGTDASLQPASLALGPYNLLYVADADNHRLRAINTTTGNVVTIAGTGVAGKDDSTSAPSTATFNNPRGIMVDNNQDIYITHFSGDCSIRMVKILSMPSRGGGKRRSMRKRRRSRSSRK